MVLTNISKRKKNLIRSKVFGCVPIFFNDIYIFQSVESCSQVLFFNILCTEDCRFIPHIRLSNCRRNMSLVSGENFSDLWIFKHESPDLFMNLRLIEDELVQNRKLELEFV